MVSSLCLFGFRGALHERCLLARLQGPLGIQKAVKLNGLGHEPDLSGLMICAKLGAVVAVKILVEKNVVAPVGVALGLLCAVVHGSVHGKGDIEGVFGELQ